MNAHTIKSPPLINQASVVHVRVDSDRWSVLRYDRQPKVVARMLAEMDMEGYDAYLPLLLRRRRKMIHGKRETAAKWEPEALFPGYVFARRKEGLAPIRPMTSIYGIEGRDAVGKVKPVLIQAIKAREETIEGLTGWVPDRERRYVPADEWRASLTAGSEIEVETCGTFLRAVVTANDGMGRLRALVDLLGRSTAITVDLPVRVRAVG